MMWNNKVIIQMLTKEFKRFYFYSKYAVILRIANRSKKATCTITKILNTVIF